MQTDTTTRRRFTVEGVLSLFLAGLAALGAGLVYRDPDSVAPVPAVLIVAVFGWVVVANLLDFWDGSEPLVDEPTDGPCDVPGCTKVGGHS